MCQSKGNFVEHMIEYQRAARMPALQHFVPDLREERYETYADISLDAKHFSCMLNLKCFVQNILG
jgi:hypothetical protein